MEASPDEAMADCADDSSATSQSEILGDFAAGGASSLALNASFVRGAVAIIRAKSILKNSFSSTTANCIPVNVAI